MPTKIAFSPNLKLSKGDFGARVEGEALLLPEGLAPILRSFQVQSDDDLLSYLSTFPSAFVVALGWTVEEVRRAEAGLAQQLGSRARKAPAESATVSRFGFGALDPARLRRA